MFDTRALLGVFVLAAMLSVPAYAESSSSPVVYLKRQARIILSEGDRIKGQAHFMRSESARLKREATDLRASASRLDDVWTEAERRDAEKYVDYPGRDRSQHVMRSDADREDKDADGLRQEGTRLDEEAARLWKLAAAVDPKAQNELLKRMQACCKAISIGFLRTEIIRLAHAMGANYAPGR